MAREYNKLITFTNKRTGKKFKQLSLAKGLKIVHIGADVWKFGKNSKVDKRDHMVIYGPNDKEYHVWDKDVNFMITEHKGEYSIFEEYANVNRHGNRALESKVKIHILTSILDERKNWCTDLSCTPPVGKLKVIYQNGTVRNIDFNGKFEDHVTHPYTNYPSWTKVYKPFAYRKV